MICGIVLLDRENRLILWTVSGGIYQVSDHLQYRLQDLRLGTCIDFQIDKSGQAIDYSLHDEKVTGYLITRLKEEHVQVLGKIVIPSELESEKAGWREPAVHSNYAGKVLTSQSTLSSLRNLSSDITYEVWIEWDTTIENFYLPSDNGIRIAKRQAYEKLFLPWNLEGTRETGLVAGVVSGRTHYTTFVATEFGDFAIAAGTRRIGCRPPSLGSYLVCKLKVYLEKKSSEQAGTVLEYEVLPMPNDVQIHKITSNGMQCSFRCRAQLVRFHDGYPCLHNETLNTIYDDEKLLGGGAKLGAIYDIAVRRPKDGQLDMFDNGWKMTALFGIVKEETPDWEDIRARRNDRRENFLQSSSSNERAFDCESEVGSSISVLNPDRPLFFNPRNIQRKHSSAAEPINELHGIVINQVHGIFFISFEDDIEAAYKVKDAAQQNLFLKPGDHVLCKVKKEMEYCESSKNHTRYAVENCRIINTPKGFSMKGQTKAGVVIVTCPLTYLGLSDRPGRNKRFRYPLFTNELMPIVHDYNLQSLMPGEAPDEKSLRELSLVAAVARTRIPRYKGVNGWMLEEIIELKRVEQVSDKHESPIGDIENTFTRSLVQGFVIKKWGLFLIIWLIDGRLAVLDVRNFPKGSQPPLGSFIECDDIRETEAPYLGDDVAYYWEIFSQRPYQVNDCQGIMNEGKMSIVHCKSLIFESFRLVNKVRQAHFSHRFFGQIEDRDGVFAMSPCPGDLIEAYIRPVIIGESEIQWVIDDRRPKQKMTPRAVVAPMSRLKLSKDQNETSQSKPIPNQTESSSNHGDSPSSSQASTSKESKKVEKTREEILEMIKANKDLSQIAAEVDPDLFAEVLSSTF